MVEKTPYSFYRKGEKLSFPPGMPIVTGEDEKVFASKLDALNCALPVVLKQTSAENVGNRAKDVFADLSDIEGDGYLLVVNRNGAEILATAKRGLLYGVLALADEFDRNGGLYEMSICEQPTVMERGLKLYLPPPTENGLAEMKRILDFAANCKFNFVMLELGGALEYQSHPEINIGWMEYARLMNEYPGKTLEIQNSFSWRKNSIHSENGGGKVLSQKQFVDLVEYCRELFLEVIPEMPFLSHSDYILTRHPEFAERQNDPYPDTVCPSNQAARRLYFDLIDEVVDLIHPARINICHDEYYSVGLCPLCKDKKAHELYADDLNKCIEYVTRKGVRPIIWGEKLLNAHWLNGEPIGGAEVSAGKMLEALPAIYPAIDLIKGNPEVFHWYWTVDRNLEKEYEKHGLDYCFANLNPVDFKEWHRRTRAPHARGICLSNWGQTSFRTLQRNSILYEMVYSAYMAWNPRFGSEDYPELDHLTRYRLYRLGRRQYPLNIPMLTVCHTVKTTQKYQYFFDGFLLDENRYFLGNHVFLSEENGKEYRFSVIFGSNIGNSDVDYRRYDSPASFRDAFTSDLQYREPSFETLPVLINDEMWYYCRYVAPCAVETLRYLRFEPASAKNDPVRMRSFSGEDTYHPDEA